MASVTTRYSAPCTTLRVLTTRNAASTPIRASPTKAPSCGDNRLPLGLPASFEHRGPPGLALGHPTIGPPGQLLGQDPVERGLVGLDLHALGSNALAGGHHGLLAGGRHARRRLCGSRLPGP